MNYNVINYIKYYKGLRFIIISDEVKTIYTLGNIYSIDHVNIYFNNNSSTASFHLEQLFLHIHHGDWQILKTDLRKRKLELIRND
jgi:hypothetical protein